MIEADLCFQVMVFWVQGEDGSSMILQNVGFISHHFALSQLRWPQLESSSLWTLQILCCIIYWFRISECRLRYT